MQFVAKYKKQLQLILELLIPLVGLISGWSIGLLYFFVGLDILAKGIVAILKWRKLNIERRVLPSVKKANTMWLVLWAVLFIDVMVISILLVNTTDVLVDPVANLSRNINIMIEAAGNEIWLIPLVGFAAYAQYFMDFVKGLEFRIAEPSHFFKRRSIELLVLVLVGMVFLFIGLSAKIALLIFVFVKAIAEYLVIRKEEALMLINLNKGF